jgi:formate hydrogenlyase subunit 4
VSHVIAAVVQLLHVLLMLALAPLALGVSRLATARLAGRAGPSVLQPGRDLRRLLRKQTLFAETAAKPFEAAPAIVFATSLVAAALVPSFALGMALAPAADLIVLAGLLMLGRATLALAATESGTAVGGVGASRAMALAAFSEPALLLAILPLALLLGTTNLDVMAGVLREGTIGVRLPLVLAIAAVAVVAMTRLGGPATGAATLLREAAMADDALAEEYSGRPLALLAWAAALRRLVWLSLLADLIAPFGLAQATGSPLWWPVGAAAWLAKVAVLTLALAAWQAGHSARPGRLQSALGLALLLGLLAAAFLFAGEGLA